MPHLKGRKKYAKLEQMSIEELEKLLALERSLPQGDRDTEFYDEVEEVLLQKVTDTPEDRITNVDAAWKDFEKNYLLKVGTNKKDSDRENIAKKRRFRWRRIAVAAVVIVFILSAMVVPSAFGAENIFSVIGRWTDSIFSFQREGTNIQPTAPLNNFLSDNAGLQQLYTAVSGYIGDAQVVPTWMPEGFLLGNIIIMPFPDHQVITANFSGETSIIAIQIIVRENDTTKTQYEKDNTMVEVLTIDGISYYFMKNESVWSCIWNNGNLECTIYGEIPKDELVKVIISIGGIIQ